MTHHRAILRRRTKEGTIRLLTPVAVGDTAEAVPAVLAEYLDGGWSLVRPLHRDDDEDKPVDRFLVRYDGTPDGEEI